MVSVILPNYNHAAYLKKRIDSILAQTYADFELIIIDDCSADNSKDIIEEYRQDGRVTHIIYNEVNSGNTFIQWDKGINLAKGDLIWIAESDDFCEPVFLETLVSGITQNPGTVLAFSQSLMITPDGQVVGKTNYDQLNQLLPGSDFIKQHMLAGNGIYNASMAIFRKDACLNIPDEYKKMKYCGDWFFWVNIAMLGDVYISGKYLNYYLRHADNVTTAATKKGLDFLEGNKIFHFIRQKMDIDTDTINAALSIKASRYLNLKKKFADDATDKAVVASLYQLDPSMKRRMQRLFF
ncbi:MAG TPA: glycosyltransferase, partial [Candidatus Babeliaceae bacterium]|nr:glycosyltransferase [Candidatus Babeliaceae bacterium]